jgi:hypothetical protein
MKMEQTERKKNFCTENSDVEESLNRKNAKFNMSRTGKLEVDTSVGIMARLLASQLKKSRIDSQKVQEIVLFLKCPPVILKLNQPRIQPIAESLRQCLRRPGCEPNYTPPSSVEVLNERSDVTTPTYTFTVCT